MLTTEYGRIRTPWFGNAVYALVMSHNVSSTEPSASERYGGMFGGRPKRAAILITLSGPSSASALTAGTFRESSSAQRSVTGPSYFRS